MAYLTPRVAISAAVSVAAKADVRYGNIRTSFARPWAIALHIPWAPPVTSAVFPFKCIVPPVQTIIKIQAQMSS
jgi:hypothetical protein